MTRMLRNILDALPWLGGRNPQRIFVSYRRRGEGAGYAGRLADRLVQEFGANQCFRDIDDIESGTDFVDAISRAVGSCEIFITVMGPDWLTATDAAGQRRLDNPHDFVRLEIEAALARNIRVVPVLVGGAIMPAAHQLPSAIEALSRRQAHELSDSRWDYDVGQLITLIEKMGIARQSPPSPRKRKRALVLAGAAVALVLTVGIIANAIQSSIDDTLSLTPANAGLLDPSTARSDAGIVPAVKQLSADPASRSIDPATSAQPVALDAADALDAAWRAAIVQAMQRANQAEVDALRSLDPRALPFAFSGIALQREQLAVASLQQAGEFAVNTLHSQFIRGMQFSDDGNTAIVEAIETWSSVRYSALTQQCLYRQAPHDVPQTVQLVRTAIGWMVFDLETRGTEPPAQPCNQEP
jgi:hypothetical protein